MKRANTLKCVETFKNTASAHEKRRMLEERGIEGRIMVDPLESRYPALSQFQDVALMVSDERATEAVGILRNGAKRAG